MNFIDKYIREYVSEDQKNYKLHKSPAQNKKI